MLPQAIPDMTGIYKERWTGDRYRVEWVRSAKEWHAQQLSPLGRFLSMSHEAFVLFIAKHGWKRISGLG